MNAYFDAFAEFRVEEVSDVRGIGALRCVRLTRLLDGASVLAHELDSHDDTPWGDSDARDGGIAPGEVDHTRPFVTRLIGPVRCLGRRYLIESLPPCVPLVDVWRTVLTDRSSTAGAALRALERQLRTALRTVHERGGVHGAVCADNVVLTPAGVYGLLAAQFGDQGGPVWVRPLTEMRPCDQGASDVRDESDLQAMLEGLAQRGLRRVARPDTAGYRNSISRRAIGGTPRVLGPVELGRRLAPGT